MRIIEFDCWEVIESYDQDNRHIAYFLYKIDADEFAKKNPYRSVYQYKKTYTICTSIEEYEDLVKENKKSAALAKLTLEEKQLLGLA